MRGVVLLHRGRFSASLQLCGVLRECYGAGFSPLHGALSPRKVLFARGEFAAALPGWEIWRGDWTREGSLSRAVRGRVLLPQREHEREGETVPGGEVSFMSCCCCFFGDATNPLLTHS